MKYKHPLTGAIYAVRPDGFVDVDAKGTQGVFRGDGRHESGELTQADLHLLGWIATKHLTRRRGEPRHLADERRHR